MLEGAGHLITHLELGTLFFVRCARLYLRPTGKIAFVLPRSIFTADQHDRFRRSMVSGNTTLTEVWDLEDVSPLFNVPAAVAFGDLQSETSKTLPGEILSGELPRRNASLAEARAALKFAPTQFYVVEQGKRTFFSTKRKRISAQRSFYQPYFKEGATIVPRNFWFVEFKADPRLGIDPAQPLVATDPRAEAEAKAPYKGVHFEGAVEAEFLYGTLLSTDLLPFGHFDFRPVVLPLLEDAQGYRLIDAIQARAQGFLKLSDWLERAQKTWEEKRGEKTRRGDVLGWLNYRHKLTEQDPKAKYAVLYPASATFLCAAAVRRTTPTFPVGAQEIHGKSLVAESKTYMYETNQKAEAQYLVAVLNSPVMDSLMKPMQTRGQWGPRDIHKKPLELPIPEFKGEDPKHVKLAELGEGCADKVKQMVPELRALFKHIRAAHAIGRARAAVRQALSDELKEIDRLVEKILL